MWYVKNKMTQGSYVVTTDNYKFELNMYKYGDEYSISYGDPTSKEGVCVGLTYDITEPTMIKLDYLKYEKRCSKDNDLLKGTGTQEMLKSILQICIHQFPQIKRVIFHDVSSFECNDLQVSLSIYYLLLYGDTWYEDKFEAKFTDKKKRIKLDVFKALLNQKPNKNVFSFYDHTIQAETWHEYFRKMKAKIGCEFMMRYQHEIEKVAEIKFMYSSWYITVNTIKSFNLQTTMIKLKKGGNNIVVKPVLKFILK